MSDYSNIKLSLSTLDNIIKSIIRKNKNDYIIGLIDSSSQFLHKRKRFRTGSLLCEEIFGYAYLCKNNICKKLKFNENIVYNNLCHTCGRKMRINKHRKYRFGAVYFNFPIFNPLYLAKCIKYIDLFKTFNQFSYYNLYAFEFDHKYFNSISTAIGNSYIVMNVFLNFINLLYKFFSSIEILKYKLNSIKSYKTASFLDLKILNTTNNLNKFKNFILILFPVLPINLRHSIKTAEHSKLTSKFTLLYKFVIDINNKIINPEYKFHYEVKYIFVLFDLLNTLLNYSKLQSLLKQDYNIYSKLQGKYGIFRQNLLGFRVDYSGRSSIVSSPDIGLNSIGVPIQMLKRFSPVSLEDLESEDMEELEAYSSYTSNYDIFNRLNDYSFLINRAPTLHKMNTQSFEPIFTEGRSIKFIPILCPGYNADFDGDQMGVFSLLFSDTIKESKYIMRPITNLYSPTNNNNMLNLTQGAALGKYTLSMYKYCNYGNNIILNNYTSLVDLQINYLYINTPLTIRHYNYFYLTTLGRSLLGVKNC
uniref:DNA-directed RNA polymerase n=2 Tax=Babesia TaxID=5864 RepID=A0A411ADC9_9APIC|nr:RpoC1 [Babesia sp. Lintan]QAX27052.1 RpoC1 [Babesia motasi]QAX27083.1 RpoC1 [Babesia motasi]